MNPTNSIIIANLPDWTSDTSKPTQTQPSEDENPLEPTLEPLPSTFIESLRAVIEVHREIVHWAPVRSFRRVFCTFINEEDAEIVKAALNGCIFEGHRLDVYYGENTPLTIEKQHLEPPVLQRNWMISPPGSPKEGWVQIEEDPPNPVTLHEDIQAALDRLAAKFEPPEEQEAEEGQEEDKEKTKGQVILDTTDLGGLQVIVEDVDAGVESDEGLGGKGITATRTSAEETIGKTPRPPVEVVEM